MAKTSLLKERIVYKPFEYPEAFDFYMKQQQAHWLWTEVPMMADVNDWKQNLSETEKNIIGSILKGFAQTETVVNDYWSTLVTKWFRKPEVIAMAVTFGCFETIHAEAYSLLNEELGLDNFAEFLEDETTMAKIETLMNVRDDHEGNPNWHERAKSLAIFSAFTEGVNLFSSFASTSHLIIIWLADIDLKGLRRVSEWPGPRHCELGEAEYNTSEMRHGLVHFSESKPGQPLLFFPHLLLKIRPVVKVRRLLVRRLALLVPVVGRAVAVERGVPCHASAPHGFIGRRIGVDPARYAVPGRYGP